MFLGRFMDALFSKPFDPSASVWKRYRRNTRLIIALSVLGIVLFLTIALIVPFRDRFFNLLYPKPKTQAAACSVSSQISDKKYGFVYTGGDLSQMMENLQTPLYYTYDASLGPQKQIFMVGRYANNFADPLGLKLLMGGSLSNAEFKGLWGQVPAGWNVLTSGGSGQVAVDTAEVNTISGGTSVKITNNLSPSGTQITQVFKKDVTSGQYVVFGSWVKTDNPESVKIVLQNGQAPYEEFGELTTRVESRNWNYVYGYGRVPEKISNFQLVLRVVGPNTSAWFDEASVVVLGNPPNQAFSDMVLERCGSAWFVDHEQGWEQTYSDKVMKPLDPEIYSLLYSQFYSAIKNVDPAAVVMPGGLAASGGAFDQTGSYSPKTFLESFRKSYRKFFNSEPPLDSLDIHYLASDQDKWLGIEDLKKYLGKLRIYLDEVPEWKGKPIWVGKLGVARQAPSGGVDFIKAATAFLNSNELNITKWFWFDTCGFNPHLASLFETNNKLCSWPAKLTALGQAYVNENLTPTPTSAPTLTPTPTPTPTLAPSPTVVSPTATVSATLAPTATPLPTVPEVVTPTAGP